MIKNIKSIKKYFYISALTMFTVFSSSIGYADAFSDIGSHWARNYISHLSSKSIINGYSDGSFRPDNNVIREEAAKIIYEYTKKTSPDLYNSSESSSNVSDMFSDVVKERWSYDSIKALMPKDIISGYPNGTFQPEREISRAEYSKLIYYTLLKTGKISADNNSLSSSFSDVSGHWAEKYISVLAKENIIKGYSNGEFRPDNSITRAEASTIVALTDNLSLKNYVPEESESGNDIGTGLLSIEQPKNTMVQIETIIKYKDRSTDSNSSISARLESVSGNHKSDVSVKEQGIKDRYAISFDEKDLVPGEEYRLVVYLDNNSEQLYTLDIAKNAVLGRVYGYDKRLYYKRDATELNQLTIENLLRKALEPVGNTLYVWGGGWNQEDTGSGPDAVTMGVSPKWAEFYNSYGSDYNYNNTRFQIRNGLDCSGYVGWIIYNTFNTEDNKDGYVMLADKMSRNYSNRGWGSFESMGSVTDYKPGDIMSSATHVYMVIGKAEDGSIVLVHSSPSGVQINGTPSPYSSGRSKAQNLAEQYMNKYYTDFSNKFPGMSRDSSYLRGYDRMSWNIDGSSILTDPQGLKGMSAEEVLKYLFSE